MRIVPHGDVIVASDRTYYKDGGGHDSDVVMGVSNPAILLANLTIRKPVKSALDLGTGGGIQALLMANHCERVVATDLNPRALEIARFNAALNGFLNIETRGGSWFEPVAGERFDIIAANPPYVISPETTFLYRDSGMPADSLSRELVREMPQHLEEGGFGHILISWGVAANQDPLVPARQWLEGAIARRPDFTGNRIVIAQLEGANQRAQRQPLDHERPQDHGKRREDDQISKRKCRSADLGRKRQRRRERDDPAHAGPPDDERASKRRGRPELARTTRGVPAPGLDNGVIDREPADPHDDHRDQNDRGNPEIPDAHRRIEGHQDRANLEADEHEGQHVEHEDRGLPHRI